MAISFPITLPNFGFRSIDWTPKTAVAVNQSPYSAAMQVQAWPAQWWEATVTLPSMLDAKAGAWCAALLSLQGRLGTFYLGPSVRTSSAGTISGALEVGAGAVAGSTTLPLQGGTGSLAVGDWVAVGYKLHQVLQVNVGSVDVFPTLRSAYAQTTLVVYTNPVGVFRLSSNNYKFSIDQAKVFGVQFSASEVLP